MKFWCLKSLWIKIMCTWNKSINRPSLITDMWAGQYWTRIELKSGCQSWFTWWSILFEWKWVMSLTRTYRKIESSDRIEIDLLKNFYWTKASIYPLSPNVGSYNTGRSWSCSIVTAECWLLLWIYFKPLKQNNTNWIISLCSFLVY